MENIKIGVTGIVTNGWYPDMHIRIEHDSERTGGYYIYLWWEGSNGPNANNAFDDWVETKEDIGKYIKESGWIIEWQQ